MNPFPGCARPARYRMREMLEYDQYLKYFIVDSKKNHRLGRRLIVAFSCAAVFYAGNTAATPFIQSQLESLLGPASSYSLFFKLALYWSLPTALPCLIYAQVLVKLGIFAQASLTRNTRQALAYGLGTGAAAAAVTLLLVMPFHHWLRFGVDLNPGGIAGSLFSTCYEEIGHRVLLFPATLCLFRDPWLAMVLSGIGFALTHSHYSPVNQLAVGITGMLFAFAYCKTGNFLAPWLAHFTSNVVLNTLVTL